MTMRIKTAARMAWAAYAQRRWAVVIDGLIMAGGLITLLWWAL